MAVDPLRASRELVNKRRFNDNQIVRVDHSSQDGFLQGSRASLSDTGVLSGAIVNFVSEISEGSETLTDSQWVVLVDRNFSTEITLPSAVGISGRSYIINNQGSGRVEVKTSSGEKINDQNSISLGKYDSLGVMSDNENWIIVMAYLNSGPQILETLQSMMLELRKMVLQLSIISDILPDEEDLQEESV